MQITYHLLSNKGSREINEDRIGSYEKNGEYSFILADGCGGHGKGEVASRMVVDAGIDLFKKSDSIKKGEGIHENTKNCKDIVIYFISGSDVHNDDRLCIC